MIKEYELIKQDTLNQLELGKIYKIKNFKNFKAIVSNVNDSIILYHVTNWQLDNMFKEVDANV